MVVRAANHWRPFATGAICTFASAFQLPHLCTSLSYLYVQTVGVYLFVRQNVGHSSFSLLQPNTMILRVADPSELCLKPSHIGNMLPADAAPDRGA